jgi:hypothetical protein
MNLVAGLIERFLFGTALQEELDSITGLSVRGKECRCVVQFPALTLDDGTRPISENAGFERTQRCTVPKIIVIYIITDLIIVCY